MRERKEGFIMTASRTKLKEPDGCEARVQLISQNIGFDA